MGVCDASLVVIAVLLSRIPTVAAKSGMLINLLLATKEHPGIFSFGETSTHLDGPRRGQAKEP